MSHLRVLSYNLHKGFAAFRGKFILEKIRGSLRKVNADIVFLQEVVGENRNHRRQIKDYPASSQFEYLAESLWPHHVYGKNAIYTHGHHGNAILSKYPIEKWHNLNLSTNRWEQRGLLHATLSVSKTEKLHALSLHLNLTESGRRIQIQKICNYISKEIPEGERLILAGDFNDWRERITAVLRDKLGLLEIHQVLHKKHALSFPSFFPFLSLDRIYFRGLKPVDAHSLKDKVWSKLSDHAPLYAEFGK